MQRVTLRRDAQYWHSDTYLALLIFLCKSLSRLCYKNLNYQLNLLLANRAWSPSLFQSSGTVKTSDKMPCPPMNNVPVSWSFLTQTTWLQEILAILHVFCICSLFKKVIWLFSHAWYGFLAFRTMGQIQEFHWVAGIKKFGVFFFLCIFTFRSNNRSWYGSSAIRDINSFIFLLFRYGSDIRRGERMG